MLEKLKIFDQLEYDVIIETNTIYLTGEITPSSVGSVIMKMNCLMLENPKKAINLVIMSEGGDVYSMLGLIDVIHSLPVKVNTHGIGAVMSAAAIILICGTGRRTTTKHSTIMLHEGTIDNSGKATDIRSGINYLTQIEQLILELVTSHSNKNQKYWEEILKFDTYFTPEEALKIGLIDKIINEK